jgi:hypothetical protein
MVGVDPATNSSTIYRAASTATLIRVADDPNLEFEIQESAGGTAFTANDAGLNANFVVAAASTTTGYSGVESTIPPRLRPTLSICSSRASSTARATSLARTPNGWSESTVTKWPTRWSARLKELFR